MENEVIWLAESPKDSMVGKVYYEDYRLKVVETRLGVYDVYDSKYNKITHENVSKEQADARIQELLNFRNRRKKKD